MSMNSMSKFINFKILKKKGEKKIDIPVKQSIHMILLCQDIAYITPTAAPQTCILKLIPIYHLPSRNSTPMCHDW